MKSESQTKITAEVLKIKFLVARLKSGLTQKYLSEPFRRKRAKVMEEFVTSETEYVSNLDHVIHGYLVQCESNPGLFPEKLIANIFSNIRAIHDLHVRFLRRMKRAVRQNSISVIGRLFLSNQKSFEIYREYCFNFDSANTQVNSLLVQQEYTSFFNCCRTKDLRLVIFYRSIG